MKFTSNHIILLNVLISACSGTKRLPEGRNLYTGAKVKFHDNSIKDYRKIKQSLEELLVPEPNVSILGMRPRLWMYNLVGEVKKEKGIKHWLKYELGEPPVFFDEVDFEYIAGQLEYQVENKGYFKGSVSSRIKEKKQKSSIEYYVNPGNAYLIDNLYYPDSSELINQIIASQKIYSLIKPGSRFDLEIMDLERKRIESVVKDSGYYYFNNKFLTYEADSTIGDYKVDLYLKKREDIPLKATERFRISEINILPGYSERTVDMNDPVSIDSMNYYLDPEVIRAGPVVNSIKLKVGDFYSREDENITINRLASMGVFRYINLNFEEDSLPHFLRTRINLVPDKRKSIRFQLNAVSKSNNFVGPFLTVSFLNRNFFGGAEQFQVSLNSGFETQINSAQQTPLNSYELGMNTSLIIPRLIVPFRVNESDSKYNFETKYQIGGRAQKTLTTSSETDDARVYNLGGFPYAQFTKLDLDYRFYRRIDRRNRLATRIIAGVGYAYGNSETLPYTHQFAIGGSSSLRAFRPRSVGPGVYSMPDSLLQRNTFIDQTADIKIEWNIEYRFDLFKNFKGAVFLDAGNIWTIREEDHRPGSQFRIDQFYKQLALGTGFGIRYDLNFFILRLDVGTPLRIPYGPEDERWVIDDIAIEKKNWRKRNLIFNIAIGYPF